MELTHLLIMLKHADSLWHKFIYNNLQKLRCVCESCQTLSHILILFYFIFYKKRQFSFDGRCVLTIKVNYTANCSFYNRDGKNVPHHLTCLVCFASCGSGKVRVLLVPFGLASLVLKVRMCVYIYII